MCVIIIFLLCADVLNSYSFPVTSMGVRSVRLSEGSQRNAYLHIITEWFDEVSFCVVSHPGMGVKYLPMIIQHWLPTVKMP